MRMLNTSFGEGEKMTALEIAEMLGGRRVLKRTITSDLELASAINAGLPSGSLDYVLEKVEGHIERNEDVYRIVGSARTLQRKRARRTALSAGESDRLARFARILVRAEEALNDKEKALSWMSRPNRALEGKRPLVLLESDAGTLAVERILGRIEHGIFS